MSGLSPLTCVKNVYFFIFENAGIQLSFENKLLSAKSCLELLITIWPFINITWWTSDAFIIKFQLQMYRHCIPFEHNAVFNRFILILLKCVYILN